MKFGIYGHDFSVIFVIFWKELFVSMDFLCKKVFILFLICKITDFASHKRETYYFLLFYFISANDRARFETTGRGREMIEFSDDVIIFRAFCA